MMREVDCRESYEMAIKMKYNQVNALRAEYPHKWFYMQEYKQLMGMIGVLEEAIKDSNRKFKNYDRADTGNEVL